MKTQRKDKGEGNEETEENEEEEEEEEEAHVEHDQGDVLNCFYSGKKDRFFINLVSYIKLYSLMFFVLSPITFSNDFRHTIRELRVVWRFGLEGESIFLLKENFQLQKQSFTDVVQNWCS